MKISIQKHKIPSPNEPLGRQEMTLCSLGPHDCIHVMNGRVVSSGWLAAQLKHQVEVTKMGEMRQETWYIFGEIS